VSVDWRDLHLASSVVVVGKHSDFSLLAVRRIFSYI